MNYSILELLLIAGSSSHKAAGIGVLHKNKLPRPFLALSRGHLQYSRVKLLQEPLWLALSYHISTPASPAFPWIPARENVPEGSGWPLPLLLYKSDIMMNNITWPQGQMQLKRESLYSAFPLVGKCINPLIFTLAFPVWGFTRIHLHIEPHWHPRMNIHLEWVVQLPTNTSR